MTLQDRFNGLQKQPVFKIHISNYMDSDDFEVYPVTCDAQGLYSHDIFQKWNVRKSLEANLKSFYMLILDDLMRG